MSVHVHVRLNDGYAVTEDGHLLELSSCHCGASWETSYRVDEGEPESI
ncbi:hypothetical protein [Microbispora siamensis]|uniref:Uncharacterized protein n=1 Tax=Microbispora siamensis TaxID=564413 RepID=A0ABQ4GTV0_9ACTN|nr:hypothetical protein [Microbispora siamensis]GIH64852.1 hypothetical protein Msi02_56690 [Microbispora siamensis]